MRRRPARLRFARVLAILGLGLVLGSILLSAAFRSSPGSVSVVSSSTTAILPSQLDIAVRSASPQRRVFPYSIVPGGAQDGAELRYALLRDPVAAKHYANFRTEAARVVKLAQDRQAYVSYRIGDHVYWTSHKVTLHAGETLLSDGINLARTRCGNRVSEVPGPTHPSEPSEALMNAPLPPRLPEVTNEPVAGDPQFESGPVAVALLSPSPNGRFAVPLTPLGCCGVVMREGRPSIPPPVVPPVKPPVTPPVQPPVTPPPVTPPPVVPPPVVPPPVVPPPVATPEPASWELLLVGITAARLLLKLRRI
jgi:hypothetical protein